MKNLAFLLILSIVIYSCTKPVEEETLDDKKQKLIKLRADKVTLEDQIAVLEEEIAELDTTFKEVKQRLVTTMPVERKSFESYVEVQGGVRAFKAVNAGSEMGGSILHLSVDEGDYVSKGQLIARTDTEAVDKSIAEVKTSLELAEDLYTRQSKLWEQNIGTEIQLIQARNQVDQLNKKLETLNTQKSKANAYAPLSGVVERVYLKEGELAGPGSPIVQILNLSRVKVVAEVSENYLKAVRQGQYVRITIPNLEIDKNARISMIGRTVNPANRTFKVEVSMPNPRGEIKPNLLATMFIKDFAADDAVVLPTELIQQDISGQDYVFIASEDEEGASIASKVYVDTGNSHEGETIVISGLEGNEALITKGARDVSDGERIKVLATENVVSESNTVPASSAQKAK